MYSLPQSYNQTSKCKRCISSNAYSKLNSELRAEARKALCAKWGESAVLVLLLIAVEYCISLTPLIGEVVSALVSWPLSYGLYVIFHDLHQGEGEIRISRLFDWFNDFWRIVGTGLLVSIYIFLWSLLLVIPGIIKSYSYSMVPFIMKENPDMKFDTAIEQSIKMMYGYKMKLFLLDLGFIGWGLLSLLTFGVGLLFLIPYIYTSRAAFYEDLKSEFIDSCSWNID